MSGLQIVQAGCAVAWLLVAIYTGRPTLQLAIGIGGAADADAALTFGLSFVMIGFFVRWTVWSGTVALMGDAELSFWLALYAASTLVAIGKTGAQIARRGWLPWKG